MTGTPPGNKRLETMLRGMFRTLERRPVPSRLRSIFDQLDEGEAANARKVRGG